MPWSSGDVDDLVLRIRSEPTRREELVALLHENDPVHRGRGATETARTRALTLAAFGELGCPDAALPFVVEELDVGDEAVLVAAAARATRGRERDPVLAEVLVTALWNNAGLDDTVDVDAARPTWPPAHPTTPLAEVLGALALHGDREVRDELEAFREARVHLLSPVVASALDDLIAHLPPASCCGPAPQQDREGTLEPRPIPELVEVEDQDGERFPLFDFLRQGPTVVAFFYTRCGNPRKCSLTITTLARLCRQLAEHGELDRVQVAAITYDPGYDVPGRLRRYGLDRGFPFGPTVRMLRAPRHHDVLRHHLDLRVTYSTSVVSRHGIELYLLDRTGTVTWAWTHRRWQPTDILDALLADAASREPAGPPRPLAGAERHHHCGDHP